MLILVERLLGLSGRELRRALPLCAYLFLIISSTVASKAARDALFLDRFEAIDLPYVDIAIAVLVGFVAAFYIRAGSRTNLRNLQIASLLAFAASSVVFWSMASAPARESGTLFIVIYIWVGVLSVLLPMQVWTLANYVMTSREAKRAFGLIGSGAILGWIVGGVATRESVSRFGTESMLLWVAATLIVSAALVAWIWRERPSYIDDDVPAGGAAVRGQNAGLAASLRLIRDSRYLTSIAAVICLSAFVTTVVGWQFKAIAKAHIAETDQLAAFFGTFNMVAGLLSLGLQLLLTSRVLRSLGIGVTLFVVPVAMTFGSIGLLISGSLVAAAALKASDQVLRYSIDKATVELLYLPVPVTLTFRIKSFIDTVVYRFGDALGGLAVLTFAVGFGWQAIQLSSVVLVLIAGWIAAAVVARRQYVENLRESIHQHRVDAERSAAPLLERTTSDLLMSQLKGDVKQILYALSFFEASHDRAVHPAVRALLKHQSAEVRQAAVSVLSRKGDTTVRSEIEKLLYDPSLEVRTEALMYLTQYAHLDPLERIEQLGNFPDFSIRAAMVAFLARPGRTQKLEAARVMLASMAEDKSDARARLEAGRLLSILPDVFDREVRILLADDRADVVSQAIKAVGVLGKRTFVGRVIERLAEPDLTEACVEALARLGDRVVGSLRDYLVDGAAPLDIRREIPTVLQAIGTQAAQYTLMESVLDGDTVLRYRIITALNKLGQQHPERRLDRKIIETVLGAEIMGHYRSYQVLGTLGASLDDRTDPVVQGLRESMEQEAERIFRLLKILHPTDDMHSAYVGLQSREPIVHDNALEFLEAVLEPQLRALLVPLFDRDVQPPQRVALANQILGASLGDREEAIAVMILSRDPWLQSCAAYAIGELRLVKFADTLEEWMRHPDALLRTTAIDAREKLRRSATVGAGAEMA
ncbi:MAG: Npt1/Npt2 family nucleotide transporter [Vicinamibacterales bacterium]